jgi:hypothetical protein
MGEKCLPDELRTLFLFEALNDEQLACCASTAKSSRSSRADPRRGRSRDMLLRAARRRTGDVQALGRGGHRDKPHLAARCVLRRLVGVHPGEEQVYQASVRVTTPSRFFVLDAGAFAAFMKTQFPMAVHLLEGHMVGGRRQSQIIGQREKLLALGTITAGLTHQLNNPAAATARAVADLHENGGKMRHKLAMLADGKFSPEALRALVTIQDQVSEQVAKSKNQELTALETCRPGRRDRRVARRPRDRERLGPCLDVCRGRSGHRLAGTDLGDSRRRRPLVESATECHRLDEVHHRRRADDEPNR